jgi:hypothetical protein
MLASFQFLVPTPSPAQNVSPIPVHQHADPFIECMLGHVPGCTWLFKFGENPDVGATDETIWDGGNGYSGYPTSPVSIRCRSTDAADTFGSTGAWLTVVTGSGADWEERMDVPVVMTGISWVTLPGTWLRVYRIRSVQAGSVGINVGTIYCEDVATGDESPTPDDYAQMRPGKGATLMAVYTVPACKNLIIADGSHSVGKGQNTVASIYARPNTTGIFPNGAWQISTIYNIYEAQAGVGTHTFGLVPPKTDLRFVANTGIAGTAPVAASFMGYLFDIPGCAPPGP